MIKRALILEDEDLIALDMQNKLKKSNIEAFISTDGENTLEVIKEKNIDILLVDISLSGEKTGIQIVEEINQKISIPVIYTTAYDEEKIIEKLKKTNPFGYLLKPFDETELIVCVNIVLKRHEIEKELRQQQNWIASILNNITDMILVTDREGSITFLNKVSKNMLNKKENKKQHYTDFFTLLDDSGHKFDSDIAKRVIRTNMPTMFSEITIYFNELNKTMKGDCHFSPLLDEKNEVNGTVITIKKS